MKQFLFALALGILVCFSNDSSAFNTTLAQEVQDIQATEPNRMELIKKDILESFEAERKKIAQKNPKEVNQPKFVPPNYVDRETIIARQIVDNNIRFKNRIFGSPFKGLALSAGPTIDKYELGEKIEISVLIKNFSQEKIELEHFLGYGDIDEFRYALYFQDGTPVSKSELIEEYEAHINELEFYPSRGSITTQIYEPMRLWNYVIDIGRYFKIEKEGTYTLVIMRRIANSWDDGFMISNITKINIVNKKEEISHKVLDYYNQMPDLLSAADLVVGRSGAVSVAEFAVAGVPSICIPYPHHKDRQQYLNAEKLVEAGAACIVEDLQDKKAFAQNLWQKLETIMKDSQKRQQMVEGCKKIAKPNASTEIAKKLIQITE